VAAASWWLLQGSIDWFWEFAGLGMFAFALLGLAAAMRPADLDAERAAAGRARVPQAVPAIAGGVAALAVALAFALPWLAEREVQDASRIWVAQPKQAYDGLDRAARLNPLSSRPDLIAGTIAFRLGDPRRARTAFSDALARESGSPYAALELGLAEALLGNRAAALRHLRAARAADPGDGISARALQIVSRGKRPNVAAINALIDNRARDRLR
jgi:tetratricopeptide (TPR) repeat protein